MQLMGSFLSIFQQENRSVRRGYRKSDEVGPGSLPEKGVRTADVHISRFPKLIEFIKHNESLISNDLWGLLYGYPLSEIHQFTYDWEAWAKSKKLKPPKGADG